VSGRQYWFRSPAFEARAILVAGAVAPPPDAAELFNADSLAGCATHDQSVVAGIARDFGGHTDEFVAVLLNRSLYPFAGPAAR
jgi:hypothetical protein